MKNKWDANPELYAKLSEPLDSPRHAQVAGNAFMVDLAALREKHHIPELIVSFIIYCKPDDEEKDATMLQGGAGWGDQTKQLRLAKLCLDRELNALVDMMTKLATAGLISLEQLITDPRGPEPTNDPDL